MRKRRLTSPTRRSAWVGAAAAAVVVMLMLPTAVPPLPGDDASTVSETVDAVRDTASALEDARRLFDHLPDGVSPQDALGPAAHWLVDPDTGGFAPQPKDLEGVFAKIRRDIPWDPLPIPEVPEGPEPLLTALGEYAAVAGIDLPDLPALRAQVATLRMQPEAEEALSQLVRAYNQALLLEAEATKDLTAQQMRLVSQDPEAVEQWFAADPSRTTAAFDAHHQDLLGKVDMADRLQATDLLLKTSEAVKDTLAIPPLPLAPDADVDAHPLPEWAGTGDPAWDKLHHLVAFTSMEVPTDLPELPLLDLQSSLTLFVMVLGQPVEEPVPLGTLAGLPPSLSDAVAKIVTARAVGLLTGDPTLHTRLLLNAVQETEPVLEAWAAVQDLQRSADAHAGGLDVAALLEATFVSGAASPFAAASGHPSDADVPEPPRLAKLLRSEGLSRSDARAAERSLPVPVALGTAYALDGVQRVEAAREEVFQVLGPRERDALTTQAGRVASLLETGDWSADDAALVQAWADGLVRIGPDGLDALRAAQVHASASIEAGAAILAAYSASVVPPPATPTASHDLPGMPEEGPDTPSLVDGDDGSITSPLDDASDDASAASPERPLSVSSSHGDVVEEKTWIKQAWEFVKDFQIIGTASAQTLPSTVTTCRDTAFSDCEDNDVWFRVGEVIITGFHETTVGPGVMPSTPTLVIDLGGDDTYLYPVATADGSDPVRVVIDLGGDDTYESRGPLGQGAADGLGTFAMLWDQSGADSYTHDCTTTACGAQGYGSGGGTGILYDGDGSDTYEASTSRAHGSGWAVALLGGTGVLMDRGSGDDAMRALRGQGYAEGRSSVGILVNDGDASANEYWTANNLVPRYQGGRSANEAAVGILWDLGGQGTTYSNLVVPEGGSWTYMSHEDDAELGQRLRKDDALWMERSVTGPVGLGLDSRRGDDDGDGWDNWMELLAGSDPGDPESTPEDGVSLQDLFDTVVGLLPDPEDIDPEDLLDPEDIDPEDLPDPDDAVEVLDGLAQTVDIGLCAVPFDGDECRSPMHLLHIGPSSDDTIEAPALILIELGGDDTYPVEVAGPGAFYVHGQGVNEVGQQPVDGMGSIAIDLGGDDTYQDSGGPTQGAIRASQAPPGVPDSVDVVVTNDRWEGAEVGGEATPNPAQTLNDESCPERGTFPLPPNHVSWFESLLCVIGTWPDYYVLGTDVQAEVGRWDIARNPHLPPVSMLLDASGNDTYEAGQRSQGAAFSTCTEFSTSTGMLLDRGKQLAGAAWLMDLSGSDSYGAGADSQGATRSGAGRAGLLDLAGDDTYRFVTQADATAVSPDSISGARICTYPTSPNLGLFYDGAGQDTYDNTGDATPVVDPSLLDFNDPTGSSNDPAFQTQGIGRNSGSQSELFIGVFIDDGADLDTYLSRGDTGAVDLSPLKNNVVRTLQNGQDQSGSGQGFGFFLDGATASVSTEDTDGDGAPGIVETLMGTDPDDAQDHPGSVWQGDLDLDGEGHLFWLKEGSRTVAGAPVGVSLPGLLIGGRSDATWTQNEPFMVVLGGNNTYTHSEIGSAGGFGSTTGVSLFLEAGRGDTSYAPKCVLEYDISDVKLDVEPGGHRRDCSSLGAARGGIAVMVDNGGNNTFATNSTVRIRTSHDWDISLATQGVGLGTGVGSLVTYNATNRFIADLTVQVNTTQFQAGDHHDPNVIVRGMAQGMGYGSGMGLLATFGGGNDEYLVQLDVEVDTTTPQVESFAQGAVLNGKYGLLLDDGGNNTFTSSHPVAQGAAVVDGTAGIIDDTNAMAVLWSGTGDDRFDATGGLSQGSSLGVPLRKPSDNPSSNPNRPPVALLYDAGGHDQYTVHANGDGASVAQGGATFGVGLLLDVAGDDRYIAPDATYVQGVGLEGVGALLDMGGNDHYEAGGQAQAYASDLHSIMQPRTDAGTVMGRSGDYWNVTADLLRDRGGSTDVLDRVGDRPVSDAWRLVQQPFITQPSTPFLGSGCGALVECAQSLPGLVVLQPPNPVTIGLLVDLHGNDRYDLDGNGQGLVEVVPGNDGPYQALFIDAAGDDLYAHGSTKRIQHDLCDEEGECLAENDWVWTSQPVTDASLVMDDLGRLADAIESASSDAQKATELVDAVDAAAWDTVDDTGRSASETEAALRSSLNATLDHIANMEAWAGAAESALGSWATRAQDDGMDHAEDVRDDPPSDPDEVEDRINEAHALAIDLVDGFQAHVEDLQGSAQAFTQSYAASLTDNASAVQRSIQQQADAVLDRSVALYLQAGNFTRALVTPSADRADDVVESSAQYARVARDLGIDASTIEEAMVALYGQAGVEVLPLQVWSDAGETTEGGVVAGGLLVRIRVESSSMDADQVDRVTISANHHVLGHASLNQTLSDEDMFVYGYTWNTASGTIPQAFPDGDYSLRASVYLNTGPGVGAAGPPELPAAESDPFVVAIDNPPVVEAEQEGTLITPGGQPIRVHLDVGNDRDWPDGLQDPGEQDALCELRDADPCRPGATITFTRADADQITTPFNSLYLPAGNFDIPVTATEGGPWDDGAYILGIDATDAAGQTSPTIHPPQIIVDGAPPMSTITTPEFAGEDHGVGGAGLRVDWDVHDEDGTGVAGVCLFRLDDQNQAMVPAGDVCVHGPDAPTSATFAAQTGDVFRLAVAAVDAAGNTDSPCHDGPGQEEANLQPPHCIASKVGDHTDADPTIRTVHVDFDPPKIRDMQMDGILPGKEVVIRPGVPVNFTVDVTDKGTGIVAPGRVQIQLPDFDDDGRLSFVPFTANMETDGQSHYWYDKWHLHNGAMHDEPRDDELGFTLVAIDRANNAVREPYVFVVDSLPPRVFSDTVVYIQDHGTEEETEFSTGRPGLVASVRARVDEARMATMKLNISTITGVHESVPCHSDDAVTDRNRLWECEFTLPSGLPDGDYVVHFNATDAAGNHDDSEATTIHVRAEKLSFSNITVNQVTHDGFRVDWTTPFEGTSQVRYGEDLKLAQEAPMQEGFRKNHSVEVTGLKPNTDYYFQVVSTNSAGVTNSSTVMPVPVTTLNAYMFDLSGIEEHQPVRGEMPFGYDLRFKAGNDPVEVTMSIEEVGKGNVTAFALGTFELDEGAGVLSLDTTHRADGLHKIILDLDRGAGLDTMQVTSPVFRIDQSEPAITPMSPRPHSAVTDPSPTFKVELQDFPQGHAPPLSGTLRVVLGGEVLQPTVLTDELVGSSGLKRQVTFTLPEGVELPQGTQELTVTAQDAAGNTGQVTWRLGVDSLPPELVGGAEISYLPGPEKGRPGGDTMVLVSLADDSGVASVRLNMTPLADGAGSVPLLRMAGGAWKVTATIPADALHGATDLPLTAVDSLGNGRVMETAVTVVIDAEPPEITSRAVDNITYTSATINLATDETTHAWHGGGGTPPSIPGPWGKEHVLQVEGLTPGEENEVTLNVVDLAGNNRSETVFVATDDDFLPPSKVTQLQATSPSEGVVVLAWGEAIDNAGIASYRIQRSDDQKNMTKTIERIHRDEAAPAGTTVTYSVVAIDVAGNVGLAENVTIKVLALPHLFNATVNPLKGASDEPFTFRVTYSHPAGQPADLVTVDVAGRLHIMERGDRGADCRTGCMYHVETVLPPATLFDGPSAVTFTATTDGHQDVVTLSDTPIVLRGWKGGGVIDLTDAGDKETPGPGLLAMLLVLATAAIAHSLRGRTRP